MAYCVSDPFPPLLLNRYLRPLPPPVRDVADIPPDAVKLVPEDITSNVFSIPSSGLVLKIGYHVRVAEAEAMRFVQRKTSIPVPTVYDAYEKDGIGYIYMSRVGGVRLSSIWKRLSGEEREGILIQLRGYVRELGGLRGGFYGGMGRSECRDVFFNHCCVGHAEEHVRHSYGPFDSREEYNEGLVQALCNSRPEGGFSVEDEELAARVRSLEGEEVVFSHGDLRLNNICVDEEGGVSIVDWGNAGFSFPQRDYIEARLRPGKRTWRDALEGIFEESTKKDCEFLERFDGALVKYSVL